MKIRVLPTANTYSKDSRNDLLVFEIELIEVVRQIGSEDPSIFYREPHSKNCMDLLQTMTCLPEPDHVKHTSYALQALRTYKT